MDDLYIEFSNWLDKYLSDDLPESIIAVNFNLYEGSDPSYHVQFVGCDRFDEEDEDWCCYDVFTTGEDIFCVPRTNEIVQWEQGLAFITTIVEKYLNEGRFAEKLKSCKAVGIGFVDGDLDILYSS